MSMRTLEADYLVSGAAGMYERATGAEIRAYYERVMYKRLIPSGQVRFFPQCDYVGGHRIVSRLSGETFDIKVRKKLVDATYLSPCIPATTPPPFEMGAGASVIPVNQLAHVTERVEKFVIIGAGKTAMDACVWLLESGVDPGDIQWIKPREAWLLNRSYSQPGELVGRLLQGITLQMEAAAQATSVDNLFDRLAANEQLRRVDQGVRPTMYKAAIFGDWELDLLRRIENVVRPHFRSSVPIASPCSPSVPASSRSMPRSSPLWRPTGMMTRRRISCARRTHIRTPLSTGRGPRSSRCEQTVRGRRKRTSRNGSISRG